jgi:uncharacterized glyoxalase superfamily metalloenzyme YdcJ
MTSNINPDQIRAQFSSAMSAMYRNEVPQYGELIDLVAEVNQSVLAEKPALKKELEISGEINRLDIERHGAIRVGTAEELYDIRRLFKVMGMHPVGYYDLSIAGLPVHSTAFRAIDTESLHKSPFRIFTSLLRLELIEDKTLAEETKNILKKRQIITDRALELISIAEKNQGLNENEAEEFIKEALETFRWHGEATVTKEIYDRLNKAHALIADIVSFKGPHINHLTPRTLDIDIAQAQMPKRGMEPKDLIEGPPRRQADILLRQTSFKALSENISFLKEQQTEEGSHTARFGEIEQRGIALTPKGRELYDKLLNEVRNQAASKKGDYNTILKTVFKAFPDDYDSLRKQKLAYFTYKEANKETHIENNKAANSIEELIQSGRLACIPQTYEDFLPVSAAGIFQSNLGKGVSSNYSQQANQKEFEKALGEAIIEGNTLYEKAESKSLEQALSKLNQQHLINKHNVV